ncbi:hypothetical protein YC2023_062145 [Brassica napus]
MRSAFDVARSKPKLRFGDAPVTIRFQSSSHYVLMVEDDNSSAQSTEFLLARQSKFAASQVVWMAGVVNSTRSNRFANGLNITHVAALFYSSTAFAIKNHGLELENTEVEPLAAPYLYKLKLRDIFSLDFLDDSRDLTSLSRVTEPPSNRKYVAL